MLIVFVIGRDKNPLLSDSWWAASSFQKVSCGCIRVFCAHKKKKKMCFKERDKESTCNEGDLGSIPGLGRSPEKGKATHSSILAWRIPWTV